MGDTMRRQMKWVPVSDDTGRVRMEARWVPATRRVASAA